MTRTLNFGLNRLGFFMALIALAVVATACSKFQGGLAAYLESAPVVNIEYTKTGFTISPFGGLVDGPGIQFDRTHLQTNLEPTIKCEKDADITKGSADAKKITSSKTKNCVILLAKSGTDGEGETSGEDMFSTFTWHSDDIQITSETGTVALGAGTATGVAAQDFVRNLPEILAASAGTYRIEKIEVVGLSPEDVDIKTTTNADGTTDLTVNLPGADTDTGDATETGK